MKFFACMEDYLLKSSYLIKLKLSTEFKTFLIKGLYAICFGQIQLIKENPVLGLRLEEQGIVGEKTSAINSHIEIT